MTLHNLARMTSATAGTGTLTLGSAVSSFLSFADAGVANAEVVTYAIVDGTDREIGRGTYTSAGTTLSRDTVYESTNGGAKINCSGSEEVFITAAAEDFIRIASAQRTAGDLTLNNSGGFADLSTDTDLTIAALAGDKVGINMAAILDGAAGGSWTAIDAVTRVSGADTNYVSSGTGTPGNLGVPAWFVWEATNTLNSEWLYTVQSGDVSGGTVTFRFKYKTGTAANRTLRAASGQPLKVWVKNYGYG